MRSFERVKALALPAELELREHEAGEGEEREGGRDHAPRCSTIAAGRQGL